MRKIIKYLLILYIITPLSPCPNSDKLCTQCKSSKCVECRKSVVNTSGKCIAVPTEISRCLEYKSTTQCSRCEDYYTLDSRKRCFKIEIENCISLKTHETCRSCGNSKMPTSDGKKCSDEICKISNCELCFLDGTNVFCQRCLKGFVRSSDKIYCVESVSKTQNCYTLDQDGNCDECMDGYYMSDGVCLVSSDYSFDGFEVNGIGHGFGFGIFIWIFVVFYL